MTEITVTGRQQMSTTTGSPDIEIDEDGELLIYPTGLGDGSLALFMGIHDWRALNAAVETAIAKNEAAASRVIPINRGTS
ncbi:Uncharacterised protein [Mycobacteroides abscessus subsp. abscessus]|uniref:hypothetical protein n=1 Tax=Mycobacteroides abscessus TaxID=36809 RepID=UPI0009269BD1|nr:hypothetical protein [Mycobacteroides abscessus]SIJ03238.1 Uncharacterised protein [Mycobacteroides abscessus subsp. abscessus]SIN15146.1 Uncharacterised protein [Mycobacteroides abscessus subsp. abscessus]